jgi:hypothetical protein
VVVLATKDLEVRAVQVLGISANPVHSCREGRGREPLRYRSVRDEKLSERQQRPRRMDAQMRRLLLTLLSLSVLLPGAPTIFLYAFALPIKLGELKDRIRTLHQ